MAWAGKLTSKQVAALRIAFGVVWLIDAIFKWLPGFQNGFADDVMMAAQGQPHWLDWWFNLGMPAFMQYPHLFAIVVAILETLIALGLIFGIGRRFIYIGGMVVAFLIWGLGEGFGGPYSSGATDIGSAVIYIFVFWGLLLLDRAVPPALALDALFKRTTDT